MNCLIQVMDEIIIRDIIDYYGETFRIYYDEGTCQDGRIFWYGIYWVFAKKYYHKSDSSWKSN